MLYCKKNTQYSILNTQCSIFNFQIGNLVSLMLLGEKMCINIMEGNRGWFSSANESVSLYRSMVNIYPHPQTRISKDVISALIYFVEKSIFIIQRVFYFVSIFHFLRRSELWQEIL